MPPKINFPDKKCAYSECGKMFNRKKFGKRFEPPYSWRKRKYCSRNCYVFAREPKDRAGRCFNCNEEILMIRKRSGRGYIKNSSFCCRACFIEYWRKPENKGKREFFRRRARKKVLDRRKVV